MLLETIQLEEIHLQYIIPLVYQESYSSLLVSINKTGYWL